MTRRSKKSLYYRYKKSRNSDLFSFKNGKNRSYPDGSVLVSSAAVDAYRLYCGGASEDLMIEIYEHIAKEFLNIRKSKPDDDATHKLIKFKHKKIRQFFIISTKRVFVPQTNKYNHIVFIDIESSYIRFDINKLESAITEKHLFGSINKTNS